MSAKIKAALIAQAAQQQADDSGSANDARPNAKLSLLFQGALSEHSQLSLLDDVFGSFMDTNRHQGHHFSLAALWDLHESHEFLFEHRGVPYSATVSFYRGYDADYTVIRLPNNNFFSAAQEWEQLGGHDNGKWTAPTEAFQVFPNIYRATAELYHEGSLFYNAPEQRLDLVLFPQNASAQGLMLNFEPGDPYVDEWAGESVLYEAVQC